MFLFLLGLYFGANIMTLIIYIREDEEQYGMCDILTIALFGSLLYIFTTK